VVILPHLKDVAYWCINAHNAYRGALISIIAAVSRASEPSLPSRLVSSPATVKSKSAKTTWLRVQVKSKSLIAVCASSKKSIQCKWLYAVLYSLMKNMPHCRPQSVQRRSLVVCTIRIGKMSYVLNKTLRM